MSDRVQTTIVPVDVLERAIWKMGIEYRHSVERHHGEIPPEGECWAEVEALGYYLDPALVGDFPVLRRVEDG